MVKFVVYKQLGAFVVARGYAHVVLLVRQVVVCEAPVNQPYVATCVVDDNIKRLYVSVHDTVRMGIFKGLKNLERV